MQVDDASSLASQQTIVKRILPIHTAKIASIKSSKPLIANPIENELVNDFTFKPSDSIQSGLEKIDSVNYFLYNNDI